MLLFTLLLDDDEGLNDTAIWSIYYHLVLDTRSLELLHIQSKKLSTLAASIQSWHSSRYGKLLRFCDNGTLAHIREIWNSYTPSGLTKGDYDRQIKSNIQKSNEARAAFGAGSGLILTGYRSAAPLSVYSMEDLPDLHKHYWDHGTTDGDVGSLVGSTEPNPMFYSMTGFASTLHYGSDPLLGFHLATAYAPLKLASSLRYDPSGHPNVHKVVQAARLQFREWTKSFKNHASHNLTLRFFAGDAVAFCHTLQHEPIAHEDITAHWYRNSYQLERLVLDRDEYSTKGKAPILFDVIDTSNLVDHLGAINVLVATSALLKNSISATLYTETLVKKENSHKALIDKLFCGHLPTISILFGLFPLEYWTNATAISTADERMLAAVFGTTEKGQMHSRLAWKRTLGVSEGMSEVIVTQLIKFNGLDLAHILYQVYREMFQHEDKEKLFSKFDILTLQNTSIVHYHRGSFAAFLCLVKSRVSVDWSTVMDALLDLVEHDSTILMGGNYIQELYLYLHLLGVHSMVTFQPSFIHTGQSRAAEDFRAWNEIPAAVCVTLKVPRAKLLVFTKLPISQLGTPIVHCILQSPSTYTGRPWQNIFAAVHLTFGTISTSGSRNSASYDVHIAEDKKAWTGNSPLNVSFYAPTWIILQEPRNAKIAFGIQSTPDSTRAFLQSLGYEMNVFSTTLGDKDNVFITRHLPNQSAYATVGGVKDAVLQENGSINNTIRATMTAKVDRKKARIVELTAHVDFRNGIINDIRLSISPCVTTIKIKPSGSEYLLHFPAPLPRPRSSSRAGRNSPSYVEVIAPIAGPSDRERFPDFMYPLLLNVRGPVTWNMPHMSLDCLPVLDIRRSDDPQWLVTHVSLQFSTKERALRDKSMASSMVIHKDVRLNFKDSLFSLFMHFTGIQGGQSRIFSINHPTGGGVHVLFFISCLRLDLANHTVVLDTAVLPLTNLILPQVARFLENLSGAGVRHISVDDDELSLWKTVLPAYVERCRQWEHRSSCEYKGKGQIPLSLQFGEPFICSCGIGKIPPTFISGVPQWNLVSKYVTRAAISPSFPVPYLEDIFDVSGVGAEPIIPSDGCQNCHMAKSKEGKSLLKCSRCGIARYCSAECQRADWKEHKKVCSETKPDISGDGCHKCHKEKSREGKNLLKCSRCGAARYCSAECQRGDWKEHKKVCSNGNGGRC